MDIPGLIGPSFDPGTVWLVGAGPGDPGLLTLHARGKGSERARVIALRPLLTDWHQTTPARAKA